MGLTEAVSTIRKARTKARKFNRELPIANDYVEGYIEAMNYVLEVLKATEE